MAKTKIEKYIPLKKREQKIKEKSILIFGFQSIKALKIMGFLDI